MVSERFCCFVGRRVAARCGFHVFLDGLLSGRGLRHRSVRNYWMLLDGCHVRIVSPRTGLNMVSFLQLSLWQAVARVSNCACGLRVALVFSLCWRVSGFPQALSGTEACLAHVAGTKH